MTADPSTAREITPVDDAPTAHYCYRNCGRMGVAFDDVGNVVCADATAGQRCSEVRADAMDCYVDGDPFDRFPWTVTLYSQDFQDLPEGHRKAFISTANGKRIDNGEQHTYWSVASDLWEPVAVIIAKAVNAEAQARYGTPNPTSVYVDEWRDSLA